MTFESGTVARWFRETFREPTRAQERAWPAVARGDHVLLAAPTGSGKTLAAFLMGLDELAARGAAGTLADETLIVYVSPLRALSNDIEKNLSRPLAELRAMDPDFPDLRVLVRTGDTPARDRERMKRTPPHVLVTTPESLYILATSQGGRGILGAIRTVIVDEIHAVIGSKRGAHLALTLERIEELCDAPVQRIGLSATQKPLDAVARFLGGPERPVQVIDEGHSRAMDLSVRLPEAPLTPVLAHETWMQVHGAIADLVREHRSTLVFVGTRRLAERTARELGRILDPERVASHHGSLAKERRLDAEQRLKAGELDVLVATASLELGIDIGDVDLVIQIGAARSIATLLQRVGRSGHGVGRTPKGVLFPTSPEELVEAAALLLARERRELDVTPQPTAPLDVLAQQVVAECVFRTLAVDELLAIIRRSWPYRDLSRERLMDVIEMHAGARDSLLFHDPVADTVRATRRARIVAVTSGGAIPDKAAFRVVAEPEGLTVGTVDEDFAIEINGGDVFQLGNMAWRVLRAEAGVLRVVDAGTEQPGMPFWVGEAPSRSPELSALMGEVRERGADAAWLREACAIGEREASVLAEQLGAARAALGRLPTSRRLVIERFPDDSGGTQLVIHSGFGGRINRAFGLALRKRFCRSFGFELQAAANEEAILLSLGPMHSFPLAEVAGYLDSRSVRSTLRQALLDAPVFQTRWRWNVSRALLCPRAPGGKRLPAPVIRMRSDDLLAEAFPDVLACGENLAPGDLTIPEGHPVLDQTMEDCLTEAMDVEGLEALLGGLESGDIEVHTVEANEPSPLARGALAIGAWGFLDDAGLEDRRTRAVRAPSRQDGDVGVLDPEAIEEVRAQAWPDPRSADELAEALQWMGFVERSEVPGPWRPWLEELVGSGRAETDGERWYAAGASRDPLDLARARLEVLGPFPAPADDALLLALEGEGLAVRLELDGTNHWCHRRLLARIQRLTREGRRRRVRPVSTAAFRRFLERFHGIAEGHRFEGPAGVLSAVERLAGWEAAAPLWEARLLPARVADYRPEWLDQLGLSGQVCWGRLFGSATPAVRATPISLFPRAELDLWYGLATPPETAGAGWRSVRVLEELARRGALFRSDLEGLDGMVPSDAEGGLDELIGRGLVTSDSFAALRPLLTAPAKRVRRPIFETGRWSLARPASLHAAEEAPTAPDPERVALALLRRYGVLFSALLRRERQPLPWRDLHRALRLMELRGDVLGGRFVEGYAGEQFALPGVPAMLRAAAIGGAEAGTVHAADPLFLDDVLTPGIGRHGPLPGKTAAPRPSG